MAKKQPPNPYGKKGGLKHQAACKAEEAEQEKQGNEVETEFRVIVSEGGKKKVRFVDLAVFIENVLSLFIQVGKTNADGETPVKRERDAADDISLAHPWIPIKFVDYEARDKEAEVEGDKTSENS